MSVITIVFTDVVGSSTIKRSPSLGRDNIERDKRYIEAVQIRYFELIRRCNKKRGGQEVSTIGDAFYLVFSNPIEAVRCTIDIQKHLANEPIQTPLGPLSLRIGIHTGSPQQFENGWHGTDVDTAARIEALAEGGQILLSAATHELVRHTSDINFYRVGQCILRGIGSIIIWEVDWEGKGSQSFFSGEPVKTRKEQILISLRRRLENDFFMSGQRKGEFGRTRIPNESHLFHEQVRENLKHKAYYFLTYWGWEVMPKLLPNLVKERSKITSQALKDRFGGKRWIEVDLEGFDTAPTVMFQRVATVRHTAKAAEILLLNNESFIPSQVAWDLVNEAPHLMNTSGGWKEFNLKQARPKLWASINVFRLLSKIRARMCLSDVPGEFEQFVKRVVPLLKKTESYLESHWHRQGWKFGSAPSKVNAPLALIDLAPLVQNDLLVDSVYQALRTRITPAGRLHHKQGLHQSIPEYVLSIRMAYSLMLTDSLKNRIDPRVERLANWVLDNYSDDHTLDTCDIAFLYQLVKLCGHNPVATRTYNTI